MSVEEQYNTLRETVQRLGDNQLHQDRVLQDIQKDIQEIRIAVIGDMSQQDKPSILQRLDRLEVSEKSRTKALWTIFAAVVGLFLERLKAIL